MQIHRPRPYPREADLLGPGLGIWQGRIFIWCRGHQRKVANHCSTPDAKPEHYSQSLHVCKISSASKDSPEFLSDNPGKGSSSGFSNFFEVFMKASIFWVFV